MRLEGEEGGLQCIKDERGNLLRESGQANNNKCWEWFSKNLLNVKSDSVDRSIVDNLSQKLE